MASTHYSHDGLRQKYRDILDRLCKSSVALTTNEYITHLAECNRPVLDIVSDVLNKELDRMKSNDETKFVRNGELTVFGNSSWSVTIKSVTNSHAKLSTFPLVSQLYLLAGEVELKTYKFPSFVKNHELSNEAPTLSSQSVQALKSGDQCIVDGRRGAIELTFCKAVFLRVNKVLKHDIIWHYGKNNLPTHASPNVSGAPGLVALISCCSRMSSKSSVDILAGLCRHSSFDIRWRAFQALGQRDGERALALKDYFLSDPNAMIRRAARKTFAAMSE